MSEREHPPSKRFGWTRKVRVGGQKLYVNVNEYLDGRPCEVFLVAAKTGTLVQSMLSAWAISVSVQLQYGVPLEDIVCSFEHTKFEPCGPVSGDAEIRQASSLLDYIVRRLKLDYITPKEVAAPAPPVANGEADDKSWDTKPAGYVSKGSGV